MSRRPSLTRAERRERRPEAPTGGPYGVDTEDAAATSWIGRYVMWAKSPEHAAERLRDSGFHKRKTLATWDPNRPPPEGWPERLSAATAGWFRNRDDDGGWTGWEELPAGYRHPPQGRAAIDPSVR